MTESRPAEDERAFERPLAVVLVIGSMLFALIIQSGLFARSDWMLGDITYHRGVAYTMIEGERQGQGPLPDLLSYYGGLYPMSIAAAAKIADTSFDRVLSVASWPATLLLPISFLLLGLRLWPRRPLAVGLLVLLATTAAPWSIAAADLWVWGVLPSASSFWPAFPRDIGLALLVLCVVCLLDERRLVRVGLTGVLLAVLITVHVQIAVFGAAIVAIAAAVRAVRTRRLDPLLEGAGAGALALVLSVWWWLPRLGATIASGGLILADHPTLDELRMDIGTLILAFGVVGVLAFIGLAAALIGRRWSRPLAIGVAWVAVLLPLVLIDRLGLASGLFSERRVWLLASVGLVVIATAAATDLVGSLRRVWAVAFVAVALVVPSLPATIATFRDLEHVWPAANAVPEGISQASWRSTVDRLRAAGDRAGRPERVVTYDELAVWLWSFSGAQVHSLWLPGYVKLGFDPEVLTGRSYLDRVADLTAAWDDGLRGACALAREIPDSRLVLWAHDGLVAAFDRSLGAPYRVDPRDRSTTPPARPIAPGITYRDRNQIDVLELDTGAVTTLSWPGDDIRRVGFLVRRLTPGDQNRLLVEIDSTVAALDAGATQEWRFVDVESANEITLRALSPVEVVRVTGFVPWTGRPVGEGLFNAAPDEVCAS